MSKSISSTPPNLQIKNGNKETISCFSLKRRHSAAFSDFFELRETKETAFPYIVLLKHLPPILIIFKNMFYINLLFILFTSATAQ